MMQKKLFFLAIFGITVLGFIALVIFPLLDQIQKESETLIFQRYRLVEEEAKVKNFKEARAMYKIYESDLAEIKTLFIDPREPVNFIEFLEKEAYNSGLIIEILPASLREIAGDPWPSMNFQLVPTGSFDDFLGFLVKLESSPYLIDILNLNIESLPENSKSVSAVLLIKFYAASQN